jgi:PAS domain S-box-containing protein
MANHKLVQRYINKYLTGAHLRGNEPLLQFMDAINESLQNYEQEKALALRAFELAENEYQEINKKLIDEKTLREQSIKTLLSTISNNEGLSKGDLGFDANNLLAIADYIDKQVKLRTQVEANLRESESNFREINETIEDVFWLFDALTKKYIYISPSCKILFDTPQADFYDGMASVETYVLEEDLDLFKAGDHLLNQNQSYEIEYRIKSRDGHIKYIQEKSSAIRNAKGELIRNSGVYANVTARKNAEEESRAHLLQIEELKHHLEMREEQYRKLIESASDIIYELDENGKFIFVNSASEGVIGYTNEELLTKHFWELIHPDYTAAFTKEYLAIMKAQQQFSYMELPIKAKSGEKVWLGQKAQMFFKDNWLKQVTVVARDITKQKQSEEEIQKLSEFQNIILDGTDYSIITTSNPDGIITSFNKGAELMTGYTAAEVIGIMSPAIIHDPNEVAARAKKLTEELNMPIAPGVDVFHSKARLGLANPDVNEWTYIHKNGSRITVELSLTTLKDTQNNITGYLGIAKDITERKKSEIEILKSKEVAEAASQAKSEFLANMSHEIRTPLNGVIGFTDLLMDTEMDKVQSQYMATVNQSAHSLLDIVNNILDFSKIEAGKLELHPRKAGLRQMVAQVADTVRFQVNKKRLEMRVIIAEDAPPFIWADEVRVKQVLINLLGNAVKFTPSGKIELKVEVIHQENGAPLSVIDSQLPNTDHRIPARQAGEPIADGSLHLFRFSVRDTGIGISIENQAKVFQAFTQEDTTTTKKYGGTGLGLTISNKLLAMMNSHLQLQSTPGEGSLFYFDVRLQSMPGEDMPDEQPIPEAKKENARPTPISGPPIKILIVEDNSLNMTLVKIIIKDILPGVILIEAANGKLAIEQFIKEQPHLVFMDVQMPEMNGYDATAEIRRIEKSNQLSLTGNRSLNRDNRTRNVESRSPFAGRVPIIALTAGIVQGEKEKCFEAGMDDYVSKPIVDDAIRKAINKWVFNG